MLPAFLLIALLMITACGGGEKATPTQTAGDESASGSGGSTAEATKPPESNQATATPTPQATATPENVLIELEALVPEVATSA